MGNRRLKLPAHIKRLNNENNPVSCNSIQPTYQFKIIKLIKGITANFNIHGVQISIVRSHLSHSLLT